MAQTLNIFRDIYNLLQILILSVVENRVVDDDAIDIVVCVRSEDGVFDFVARDEAACIADSTMLTYEVNTKKKNNF